MRLALLMPAFNIGPWSADFNSKLSLCCLALKERFDLDAFLVFVDDGSTRPGTRLEAHLDNLRKIKNCRVSVARHHINRGQGAALATALKIAKGNPIDADFFVTLDSDEQHNPLNVLDLFEKLRRDTLNIVFGNRFGAGRHYTDQIPFFRKWLLYGAIRFERIITGLHLLDAHNGFRLLDRRAADILDIKQDRMAHATEIKWLIHKNRLKYGEAPVQIRYPSVTTERGQKNSNAINVIQELIREWVFQ